MCVSESKGVLGNSSRQVALNWLENGANAEESIFAASGVYSSSNEVCVNRKHAP